MAITTKLSDLVFGTPISNIEVPDHLNRTCETGVNFVDDAMGGSGFTPSSVTLFTGEPGSGKTTMVLTIASAVAKQHKKAMCVFNTAEESLFQIKKTTNRLRLKGDFLTGNSTEIDDVIAGCRKLQEAAPEKQLFLVIDSLQQMNATHDRYGKGYRSDSLVLEKILQFCKETHAIALIINQVNKSGKAAGSNKLKHMVDAHCHLRIEDSEKSEFFQYRVFEVPKNRFGGAGHGYVLDMTARGLREYGIL